MLVLRVIATALVPLVPEEAYYWLYAQHPNLSYFDHPPMVAWIISLGTKVFGHTEWGVRIVNATLMIAASLLLYRFGRTWFPRRAALLAAVSLHVLPLYFGVGFITTMDGALLMFWALGMVGFSEAVKRGRSWGWYLAGIAVGGALLSKYTGLFLGAGYVLAVIGHRPWRRWFLSPHPYLAAGLGIAMFSPVLIWNSQNDWASFRFQFIDRYAEAAFDVKHILAFLGIQFIVMTPVVLIGVVMLLWRIVRPHKLRMARWWVTLCFALPLLLVTGYKAIRYDVHINWTLPAYLALLPAVIAWAMAWWRKTASIKQRADCLRPWKWTAIVCVTINLGIVSYLLVGQPYLRWAPQFGPWDGISAIVEEYEDRLEAETNREPLIIAEGKYRLASVLAFYRMAIEDGANSDQFTTSQWVVGGEGLGFRYWVDPMKWKGADCIFVSIESADDLPKRLGYAFESIQIIDDPRLTKLNRRGYGMAICRGLKIVPSPPKGKMTIDEASAAPLPSPPISSVPLVPSIRSH